MNRNFFAIISIIFLLMLAACGGNKVDDETATKFTSQAEKAILLLNEGNYEEVHTMFSDKMKTELPVDAMVELTPIFESAGNYNEIEKASIEKQDDFFVTVTSAKYSNEKIVFTITFNENEEIEGLFVK